MARQLQALEQIDSSKRDEVFKQLRDLDQKYEAAYKLYTELSMKKSLELGERLVKATPDLLGWMFGVINKENVKPILQSLMRLGTVKMRTEYKEQENEAKEMEKQGKEYEWTWSQETRELARRILIGDTYCNPC